MAKLGKKTKNIIFWTKIALSMNLLKNREGRKKTKKKIFFTIHDK